MAEARKDAITIFQAGVKAVDPAQAIKSHIKLENNHLIVGGKTTDLSGFNRISVIGVGKASAAMAGAMEEILGERLNSGLVITKHEHALPLDKVQVIEAGHPVPDQAGFRGARQIVQVLEQSGEKDLVFFLISGGGSALFPYPQEGLTLEDKQDVTKILLDAGANIHEINVLRKHLSRVKGGRLAKVAYPAALISLVLSDVIGDDLDSIASGPTVPDHSTFRDCLNIMEKYQISERLPSAAVGILQKGVRGELEETPKPGNPVFERTQNLIIGSNIIAVEAAAKKAEELGYNTLILSTFVEGETREVARVLAAVAQEILSSGNPIDRPACVLSGGETTVTIHGKGKGGRNQEFSLAAAMDIDGLENVVLLSAGTDGTDGPTDAAGAIADGTTTSRAGKLGMDPGQYLRENDSYHFFEALDDLIITGPTYTNVMDLRIILVI
ncbi:MAG: glycerate kinase [Candidatus Aminicenantes bacterium]|nr:MAG: glycerate kinase [Candidatus Aminicenantes bacterium]